MAPGNSKEPSFIAPERLYTLKGFIAASGVSATRMREARRAGVTSPVLEVGSPQIYSRYRCHRVSRATRQRK